MYGGAKWHSLPWSPEPGAPVVSLVWAVCTFFPKTSQFLEIIKNLPTTKASIWKLTNPESIHPTTSATGLSFSGLIFFCPNRPRTRYQTTQNSPYTPEPKLFKLLSLKNLLILSCLFLPMETIFKDLATFSPLPSIFWLTLLLLQVALYGIAWPFLFRIVSYKLSFWWQSFSNLWVGLAILE